MVNDVDQIILIMVDGDSLLDTIITHYDVHQGT